DVLGMWQELLGGDLYVILDQAEEYFLYHGGENGGGTFASEFPAVVNDADLRVNFILAVRDDSLAKLDAFRKRIPNVFGKYLQLVLRRLWDEEHGGGSHELRVATLQRLGGAEQIVQDHVERALSDLSPDEKDIAAALFDHLITPSGTKIAHEASDLAEYAGT